MNSINELIVVAGPTASGKTSYAINLAKEIDAVLINADSMQVYKGMNIGTNKGTIEIQGMKFSIPYIGEDQIVKSEYLISAYELEKSGVTGYMFDVVNPNEEFTVAHYQFLVKKLLNEFDRIGQKAILVGGTGLYIDSIIHNYHLDEVEIDKSLREKLNNMSDEQLFDELYKVDSVTALALNKSDKENPRRLIRRIELAQSEVKQRRLKNVLKHKIYYPIYDRNILYERINKRVDEMFDEGLVQEVEDLVGLGYKNCKSMQGMGYKEVFKYLDGKSTMEEAKARIKQAHRNYASRQITWFENEKKGYNLLKVCFEG
jgi:tRNA dimethylallyltransferase